MSDSALGATFGISILVLLLSGFVICLLKGKIGLALLGLIVHPCWLFGACLLAKPGSAWAGWFYDDAKLARARAHHGADRSPGAGREVTVWRPPE